MRKRIFTQKEIDKVIYNYTVLKMGQKKAGAEFGMSDHLVKRLLIENDIHVKNIQETNVTSYSLNENFFDQENADMAYVLGLLGSDGSIASHENCIYIELQESDSALLEEINRKLENGREVKYYKTKRGYKNCKLYFFSRHIKDRLKYYNLIPNKTYDTNFDFPRKLNKQYWIDYIRGYFDGDGCISKTTSLRFKIDGTNRKLLECIQSYFKEEHSLDTQITVSYPNEKNHATINKYSLYAYGKTAEKIYDLMYYSDNILKLDRKYQRYLKYCKKK